MSSTSPSGADLLDQCRRRYRSGRYLPERARDEARRILVVALDHGDEGLEELVEQFVQHQVESPDLKPLFLVGQVRTEILSRFGLQFETLLNEAGWLSLALDGSYDRYRRDRVRQTADLYDVSTVITVHADRRLPAWALP